MNRIFVTSLAFTFCLASLGNFHLEGQEKQTSSSHPHGATHTEDRPKDMYAPYEFLIGEWDVKSEDNGPVVAVQRVRWGPNRSYLWCSVALLSDGREEPHLEGMLMWNGVHKNLDMLFAMDLKSGRVQEQGTMSVAKDGGLVRDITAVFSEGVATTSGKPVGPAGTTVHFRQTYKQMSPDKIETSAMHETADHSWVASFPGSDHLIMTRRSG
jgi:hypothetical protein